MPSVAICVPIRDERAALPGLLAAVRGQSVRDLVLCCWLDGCRDDSEAVVRAHAGDVPLRCMAGAGGPPNAGRARAAAMQLGLAAGAELLLCTDADSAPAPDWVAAARGALARCDAVAGWIERDAPDPLQARVEAYYVRLHALRRALVPVEWEDGAAHHMTGGANLALSAAAYRAVGGFRPLPSGEDAALADDLGRAGLRLRRDRALRVRTSARRQGRAPDGLAAQLDRQDRNGVAAVRVADPAGAAWQWRRQARARQAFARLPDRATAAALGAAIDLSADHVIGVWRDCPNAEAFAMRLVPAPPTAHLLGLGEAELALARLAPPPAGRAA